MGQSWDVYQGGGWSRGEDKPLVQIRGLPNEKNALLRRAGGCYQELKCLELKRSLPLLGAPLSSLTRPGTIACRALLEKGSGVHPRLRSSTTYV